MRMSKFLRSLAAGFATGVSFILAMRFLGSYLAGHTVFRDSSFVLTMCGAAGGMMSYIFFRGTWFWFESILSIVFASVIASVFFLIVQDFTAKSSVADLAKLLETHLRGLYTDHWKEIVFACGVRIIFELAIRKVHRERF